MLFTVNSSHVSVQISIHCSEEFSTFLGGGRFWDKLIRTYRFFDFVVSLL